VCVIDEDFARYYWPKGNAIGQRLFHNPDERPDREAFTVVGVVAAVKQVALTDMEAPGAVYYPFAYHSGGEVYIVVRTGLLPELFGLTLQKLVREIDPDLPLTGVRTMESRVSDSLMARRTPALFAALFSAIALLLTALGTYGVLSYAVANRRREIGIRMALGANPGIIRLQFMRLSLRLLTAGTLFGAAGAWIASRAMQAMLFRTSEAGPLVLAGAVATISMVAIAACLLPSNRAARIPPVEVLNG
jgi:predicted lysophospholipase L1 biosynthesis ABC-type transport system permease subunit